MAFHAMTKMFIMYVMPWQKNVYNVWHFIIPIIILPAMTLMAFNVMAKHVYNS